MGTTLNLRLFRKANKLTQDAVADYLGVTKGFISQVETGKSSLPEDKLQKLLDNPQWSLDEYKRMAASFLAISVAKPEDPVPVAVGDGDVLYRVPLLPIFAQAGHLTGWSESVMESQCEKVVSPVKDVDMAVHIYGESMYPDIPNGSVVYVRKVSGRIIDFGHAYILDTVDGPVLKYLTPGADDDHIRCLSANHDPKFAPYEVLKEDILGMYKVVMCMRMM